MFFLKLYLASMRAVLTSGNVFIRHPERQYLDSTLGGANSFSLHESKQIFLIDPTRQFLYLA